MIESIEDIATRDGAMETFVCHPERGGPHRPATRSSPACTAAASSGLAFSSRSGPLPRLTVIVGVP